MVYRIGLDPGTFSLRTVFKSDMSRLPFLGLVAVVALAASPPLAGQQEETSKVASTFDPGQQQVYPGDVIRLEIWREPDFSGDFLVDPDGTVVLPRLGTIQASGKTARGLEQELVQGFRTYLRNPSIKVSVLRRVRIVGAVREPNLYHLDATVSVADALAGAGGVTPQGSPDKVELRRGGEVILSDLGGATSLAETPIRSGDQLYVPERSWVSRNAALVAAGISAVVSITVALIR